jgi:hypothetical protein
MSDDACGCGCSTKPENTVPEADPCTCGCQCCGDEEPKREAVS